LQRFFEGQTGLCLLAVDTSVLGSSLKWEKGVDVDETFPHVYGVIPAEAILSVSEFYFLQFLITKSKDIKVDEDGHHVPPVLQ
jgi:uncharacterized protein (DUF952 family)